MVSVLHSGVEKWKEKLVGVRPRAVTSDHTLTRGVMLQVQYRKFGEKYGCQVLPQLPYSQDMSPPDFDLFPKLKKPLRGKRFRSIEVVIPVMRHIKNEGVLTGIQDLPQTLDRCDKAQ